MYRKRLQWSWKTKANGLYNPFSNPYLEILFFYRLQEKAVVYLIDCIYFEVLFKLNRLESIL